MFPPLSVSSIKWGNLEIRHLLFCLMTLIQIWVKPTRKILILSPVHKFQLRMIFINTWDSRRSSSVPPNTAHLGRYLAWPIPSTSQQLGPNLIQALTSCGLARELSLRRFVFHKFKSFPRFSAVSPSFGTTCTPMIMTKSAFFLARTAADLPSC